MTAKEQRIYSDLMTRAVCEGIKQALKELKVVMITPHPTNPDAVIVDSSHHEFHDK